MFKSFFGDSIVAQCAVLRVCSWPVAAKKILGVWGSSYGFVLVHQMPTERINRRNVSAQETETYGLPNQSLSVRPNLFQLHNEQGTVKFLEPPVTVDQVEVRLQN